MKEGDKENVPQRPSLLKTSKDNFSFNKENKNKEDSIERLRSKSVTFNKAVILNLLEQSSEQQDEQTAFEKDFENTIKLNLEKLFVNAANEYLDSTIISSQSSSSQCLQLQIDSATNFDLPPGKSFLNPGGAPNQSEISNSNEIGDIPIDSMTSIEQKKQDRKLSVVSAIQQKPIFISEFQTISQNQNQKLDRFEAKIMLQRIQSVLQQQVQFGKCRSCEIINSTMYSVTMRKYQRKLFNFLMCCSSNKGGLIIKLQNQPGRKLLRLICVSGNSSKFLQTKNQIKCRLWSKGLIKLSEKDSLVAAVGLKNQKIIELKQEINYLKKKIKNQTLLEIILAKILNTRFQIFQIFSHNYTGPAKPENLIEKPLFGGILMEIYGQYTRTSQQHYSKKRQKIVQTWSIEQCFEYLQIDKSYRLKNDKQNQIPYSKAIKQFQGLNYALSPLDKLNCITAGYKAMKQCCSDSELQLQTMDAILPLLIFIILRSDIQNICANIRIVQNFINIRQQHKLADKMVTNVYVATQYISISWDEFNNK